MDSSSHLGENSEKLLESQYFWTHGNKKRNTWSHRRITKHLSSNNRDYNILRPN